MPSHFGVSIREAGPADAKDVAALFTELGYPCSEADARSRLLRPTADRNRLFLAVSDGHVVGLACVHLMWMLHADELWCRLTSLVVTESHRGRGIGAAMIEHVERYATAAGAVRLEVTCNERREEAHHFYLRHGFHESPKRFLKVLKPSQFQVVN